MSKDLSILIVDDEPDIVEFLTEEFSRDYSVRSAESGLAAWAAIDKMVPDLVLLDITMPGMNGLDLCRKIRASRNAKDVPVLFLSARTELDTIVSVFELGADDFNEKPFRIRELKARVAAKLRAKVKQARDDIQCGNLTISPKSRSLEIGGRPIEISALEFRLLRFFVENPGQLITRDKILAGVWKGQPVSPRTVDAHLVSVRKLISDCDHEIVSLYGEGYSFRSKPSRPGFLK